MDREDGITIIRAYEEAHANVAETLSEADPSLWTEEATYILRIMSDHLNTINRVEQFAILRAAEGIIKTELFLGELSGQFEQAMEITGEYH